MTKVMISERRVVYPRFKFKEKEPKILCNKYIALFNYIGAPC